MVKVTVTDLTVLIVLVRLFSTELGSPVRPFYLLVDFHCVVVKGLFYLYLL
jgi:hypothetical protein